MNKTRPVVTAATFGPLIALVRRGSLYRLPILLATLVGSLVASVWGFTIALASPRQQPLPVEVDASNPPVIATGSVWGIGA